MSRDPSELLNLKPADIDISSPEFAAKKRRYFTNLAAQEFGALLFHRTEGLWQRDADGVREWGNVTEHCLVEVARVEVLGETLQLEDPLVRDLKTAAALHDYYKKGEVEIMQREGMTWESYAKAQVIVEENLTEAGFGDRIVRLAGSVGHETVPETETILAKPDPDQEDIAYLVMHFVDDFTINSDWVTPAEQRSDGMINDLDRRLDRAEANPRYQGINEAGRIHFNGETAYHAQRRVGHAVERRLSELLEVRSGVQVEPVDLPAFTDNLLKLRIDAS